MHQAVGVGQLASKGQRCAASLERLFWIAQEPQYPSGVGKGIHPEVIALPEIEEAVLLRVVEGNGLLLVCPCSC
jgi:hypothetical protein